jgi:hypothetical protein
MVNPVAPFTQMPTVPHWPISQSELAPVSSDYPMPVTPIGSAEGAGLDTRYVSCTASTNATVVKAAPGKAFEVRAFNNGSVPVWLKLYNKASAPNPASDPVFDKYEIVSGIGGAGFINSIELGQEFSTGIAFAVTANFGDTDNTAIGAGVVSVTILYK